MQSCMLPYIILNDPFVFVTNGALLKEKKRKSFNLLVESNRYSGAFHFYTKEGVITAHLNILLIRNVNIHAGSTATRPRGTKLSYLCTISNAASWRGLSLFPKIIKDGASE